MAREFDELRLGRAEPRRNINSIVDPSTDTFIDRFRPFSSDPVGDYQKEQRFEMQQKMQEIERGFPIYRPGTPRFGDPTKLITQAPAGARLALAGKTDPQQPYVGTKRNVPDTPQTAQLPPGFSYADEEPTGSGLPPGFSYADVPERNLPAPTAGTGNVSETPSPVAPAPTAGISQLPEDPAERAAITLRRSASGARQEGKATRAIESVVPSIGREVTRLGEVAEKAVKTGDIPPKEAMEAAMLLNPASVAYRTGMGVAKTALTPAEIAQRETGVMSIPRAADAGPTKQAVARGLSAAPVGGGPLRTSAAKATEELQAAGTAAAARPTGEAVARNEAGLSTRDALKSTLEEMQASSAGKVKFPPRVRALLRGTDEDIVGKIATMASQDKRGADIKTLGLVRQGHSAEEWAPMQSAIIQQLGRSPGTGEFNPQSWLRNYSNLSDAGKNVLFGRGGDALRHHLDAIEAVSRRAPTWQQFEKGRASLGTRVGVSALTAVGTVMAPLAVLSSVIPMQILSRSLAKPATAAPLAQWSRAYERVMRTNGAPQAIASLTIATRNMNNTLGTDVSVDDILKGGASGQPVE